MIRLLFLKILFGLRSILLGLGMPMYWGILVRWCFNIWLTRPTVFESQLLVRSGRHGDDALNCIGTPLAIALEMLTIAGVHKQSVIADLGAGKGSFVTAGLLKGAAQVHGIELQGALFAGLKTTFKNYQNAALIHGDVVQLVCLKPIYT